MVRLYSYAVLAITGVFALLPNPGSPAHADDVTPVYKPPAVSFSGNWYVSADAMYEHVALPSYSLGWKTYDSGDAVPLQTFNYGLDGGGGRGAIGYAVPDSAFRFELGRSALAASGSTSQFTQSGSSFSAWAAQYLDGTAPYYSQFNCIDSGCTMDGTLHTAYASWQVFGKAAYDLKLNGATVTPSVAVFGGTTTVNQTLAQIFTQYSGGTPSGNDGTYAASTGLRWSDTGARVGLDVSVPIATTPLTLALSGWIGLAERNVNLSGSDTGNDTDSGSYTSTITSSSTQTVVLANIETGFAYQWTPNVTVRGFGGANFDNNVPGISAPVYATTSPAGIKYFPEVGYYAGGGVMARF